MFAVSLVVAGLVSFFASKSPDGLERVAENLGFLEQAKEDIIAVFSNYTIPGLTGVLSNSFAGIIGVCATFAMVFIVGKCLTRVKWHSKNSLKF